MIPSRIYILSFISANANFVHVFLLSLIQFCIIARIWYRFGIKFKVVSKFFYTTSKHFFLFQFSSHFSFILMLFHNNCFVTYKTLNLLSKAKTIPHIVQKPVRSLSKSQQSISLRGCYN